jgi:hypothetical protein
MKLELKGLDSYMEFYEHGNKPLVFVNFLEYLDYISKYILLLKDPAAT